MLLIPVIYSYIKGTRSPITYKKLWFAIPPLIQVLTLNFQYAGLTKAAASVAQMMYGSAVLWAAVFSYLLLHKRFNFIQYTSILAIMIGTIIVGLSTAYFSADVLLNNILD